MSNTLRLDDGFATFITLENIPTVKLYEKEVTPPGLTNGGAIDTTTMRNTAWRTAAPKQLKSLTPVNATVAYATEAIGVIMPQLGVNQPITVTFPDGSTIEFWGWLDEFTPGAHTEGEQPTASVVFVPSLRNGAGAEVAPVYADADES
jgi:hypothetical protein